MEIAHVKLIKCGKYYYVFERLRQLKHSKSDENLSSFFNKKFF